MNTQDSIDNKAFYDISYGLYIVSAREGDKDNGCICNTVIQVTDTPKQIAVTLNKEHYTTGMIQRTGRLNVSVLDRNVPFDTIRHWGFQSGANLDKAAGVDFKRAENGIIYLPAVSNTLICAKVSDTVDLGTHLMFICAVERAEVLSTVPSVTYAFYQENIKPKPKADSGKKGWLCTVCGYVYEGDLIPEDFICPVCKHPASYFKPIDLSAKEEEK